jgi:tetratricopeptide (TPR) repeat protein
VLLERLPHRFRALPLAVPALALVLGFGEFDRSRYRIAEDFSRTLLAGVPPGGHLSANDDNILFVLIYLHFVEGVRPDLDLIMAGVGDAELPPLRFNPDTDPLFLTHHPNWTLPQLNVVPIGLVFQTVRAGLPAPEPVIVKETLEGEDDPRVPKDYLTQNLVGHFHFMLGSTHELRDWPRAAREYGLAQRASPDNDVLFYNLGLIYRRQGLLREALACFERSHAINPRAIASRTRARADERVAELRTAVARLDAIERELQAALPAGLAPGSPEHHRALAAGLRARGLEDAANGHELRALAPAPAPGP